MAREDIVRVAPDSATGREDKAEVDPVCDPPKQRAQEQRDEEDLKGDQSKRPDTDQSPCHLQLRGFGC